MAKDKKQKKEKVAATAASMDVDQDTEDESPKFISPIAHPLAEKKLSKKLFKTVKKASKVKHIRRGVKEVGKAIRKGEKGLVLIAGDISPMDVIAHFPVFCEDHDIPYIFVPSKQKLGEASHTKRPTSVTMIVFGGKNKDEKAAADYKELYDECVATTKDLYEKLVY
ncbi:RNA-binding protein Nhp2 [Zychaea mexicana]|uniref:RNA-binding protein Nhp2 n=1 Tax=Zychaea mexicana TaxID=64656 RepID=UPI0022FE8397|nr:RNA-binding protein Nhp2 [Zychaea mexicana]KAI9471423.1 RNA-binding protein Nhp2 [Zychaea mexicana]